MEFIDKTPQPELTEDLLKYMCDLNFKTLREQRNKLLVESDKYLLPDFPITLENLELMKQYRKALRDFTNNDYIIPDKPF